MLHLTRSGTNTAVYINLRHIIMFEASTNGDRTLVYLQHLTPVHVKETVEQILALIPESKA